MKISPKVHELRRRAGVSFIECIVYVALYGLFLGGGTAVFYYCWDHTRAVVFASDQIETALRAGEVWRADVRAATGEISLQSTAAGEIAQIPLGEKVVCYRFAGGEVRREVPSRNQSRLLLAKVNSSEIKNDLRGGITAWRWELKLDSRKQTLLPLLFTFEAAPPKP